MQKTFTGGLTVPDPFQFHVEERTKNREVNDNEPYVGVLERAQKFLHSDRHSTLRTNRVSLLQFFLEFF